MSEPEPRCWNCFVRASETPLLKDGPSEWICRGCEKELDDALDASRYAAQITAEARMNAQ
jgi:hypothetical protein